LPSRAGALDLGFGGRTDPFQGTDPALVADRPVETADPVGDRPGAAFDLRLIGIAGLDDLLGKPVRREQHAHRPVAGFGKALLHEVDGRRR
jgi:hypothetical protein